MDNIKQWLESAAYERQKEILRKEINSNRLEIDYSVFKKTKQERALLATLKAAYKANL